MRVEAGEMTTYYTVCMSASFESATLLPLFAATVSCPPREHGRTWLYHFTDIMIEAVALTPPEQDPWNPRF